MKALRILSLTAIVTAAALLLPAEQADAHDRYRVRSHVSLGIGYPWYGRYYGHRHRIGGSYVGVSVWPGRLTRKVRTRETRSGAEQLYVYPAAGQSQQQLAADRYDCHVWSVNQTNFDPTLDTGSRRDAQEYARAITACLEARSYVVR